MNDAIVKKFHHFLKKDKQENLKKRWEYFTSVQPEWTERKLGFTPLIIENKWAVMFIPAEGKLPEFAYTIGLYYNFNQPELMIIGADLSPEEYQAVLNTLGKFVKEGNKIEEGKDYSQAILMKEAPMVFKKATQEILKQNPYGYGSAFYTNFADTDNLPPILYLKTKHG